MLLVLFWRNKQLLTIALPIGTGIFLAGWGLQKIACTEYQQDISIRVINGNISKQQKQRRFVTDKAIQKYQTISQQLPRVDLVVWPESSVPEGFMGLYQRELKQMFQTLSQVGTEVVLGTYLKEIKEDLKHYNVMVLGSDIRQRYDKRHRVPFGEYMPDIFNYFFPSSFLEDIDQADFQQLSIKAGGIIISPSICFELLFPHLVHFQESNLLINISDLSWFGNKLVARRMLKIARTRAIEAGKYLVKSDNYGESSVISGKGRIIALAGPDDQYVDTTVQLRHGMTPYVLFNDYPLLIVFFAIWIIFLVDTLTISRNRPSL